MPLSDEKIQSLVAQFGVTVDDEAVAQEAALRFQQRLQHLKYQGLQSGSYADYYRLAMTGQGPEDEAEARQALAIEGLLKAVIAQYHLDATPEELEAEAERLAESEHASMDLVRRFFGDDLALLKRDVLERKALAILESL